MKGVAKASWTYQRKSAKSFGVILIIAGTPSGFVGKAKLSLLDEGRFH